MEIVEAELIPESESSAKPKSVVTFHLRTGWALMLSPLFGMIILKFTVMFCGLSLYCAMWIAKNGFSWLPLAGIVVGGYLGWVLIRSGIWYVRSLLSIAIGQPDFTFSHEGMRRWDGVTVMWKDIESVHTSASDVGYGDDTLVVYGHNNRGKRTWLKLMRCWYQQADFDEMIRIIASSAPQHSVKNLSKLTRTK